MKLFLAVASLWAVAVFALRGNDNNNNYDVDDRDVEVFRAGQTYKYRVDTQVSSGIASVADQHAVTRLQADAQLHFQSDRLVSLRLKNSRVGTTNQDIQNPEQIQPMQMFKETEIKSEDARLLELPCEFDYVDGLVERVRFAAQDQPWSKNIKKSVLNMLQLNLKQRKGQEVELEQSDFWQKERDLLDSQITTKPDSQIKPRMFVMPEITLEGECQVTYTINPVNPRAKFNSYYDEQVGRDEKKMFNVTKTVDFHRCRKIADIRYGPKIEKPCENCTTTQKELEERKLDRTTIVRHVVVGQPSEKFGVQRAEIISHYVYKLLNAEEEFPMRTTVAGRLILVRADDRSDIERDLRRVETGGKPETLLYSTEFDVKEKLFYMFGDDEFPRDQSPFEKMQEKVAKVENIMKKLIGMWSDKVKGIDAEATLVYTRLIELLRMCSQPELERIYTNAKELKGEEKQEKISGEELIIDALANAGTLNTIKVLAEKIKRRDVQPARATLAIGQLKGLQAPSEKIVKVITELCEQSVCDEHAPCRQVCWMTAGAIMGKLCDDPLTVDDAIDQLKPQCHPQLRKDFVAKGMRQFEKVETRSKKIAVLRALGNAGLDAAVPQLEKIIRDGREDPLVRMQAIDAMRRLRAAMPKKIQRVLLPVFHDVRERPEVRMMAASQILATIPDRTVLDQLGYTLLRDPSRQVKSYLYKAMKELSKSPIDIEKEVAQHLKALLKLAGVTEEDEETLVRGSRYYRIPVYSQAKKEGLFVELESIFGSDNLLPKHLSAGLDSLFNGLFQKNVLEISLTQEDIEQWFEKLLDVYMDYYSEGSRKSLRANRRSRQSGESSENDNSDFTRIVKDLGIQRRQSRVDVDSKKKKGNAPFAMINVRYMDMDYAMLPFEEEFLPAVLKKIVAEGRQPTVGDLQDIVELFKGRHFRSQVAFNLIENAVKVPTSAGLPVRMWHVIPVLGSIDGSIKAELRNKDQQFKATIRIHPMLAVTCLKRIEVWSPIVHSGVDSTRTAALNLPINSELRVNYADEPKSVQWAIDVPEKEFRAFNLHTLPLTYTITEQDRLQLKAPLVKRIENRNLVHRAWHLDGVYGKHDFGVPVKVRGEIHVPHRYSYQGITAALLTTENHIHVEYVPEGETSPNQIVLTAEGRFFQATTEGRDSHRQLKEFHAKSRFDTDMDEYYGSRDSEKRRFDQFLDDYEPAKMYKHTVALEVKTVGGPKDKMAKVELEATCDSQHRHVRALLKAKRSPLASLDESSAWSMKTDAQAVLPDTQSTVQQYKRQDGQKQQQRLVAKIEGEWGTSDKKQTVRLNINGEQGRNPEWRQKIAEIDRVNTPDAQKLRQQMISKAAFINKYDIAADYENLQPGTRRFLNSAATVLKSWNFWQTRVEAPKKSSGEPKRDGQLTATIVIDPITHEHANVTVKTPAETIRIDSLGLPMKLKPFKLVKPGQPRQSIDSFTDIVRDYAAESRQECKVGGSKVRSFDDVIFKAPLTKCYTVLAKDCGSERPRFAVLMKKIDGQDKALKVITRDETIEVEPKNGKLSVKINGKRVEDEDRLEEHGIDYSKESVRIATRDVTVRFDGSDASVKIADAHKNTQCGLCGHYDDDSEDEFRMSNNELTSDLKSYHKSYSVVDAECSADFDETHRREEYKQLKGRRNSYYNFDEDEEDGQQQQRRRINDNNEMEPIEKTETMEYNHKVCFSVKPVKTCPEESYPAKTKEMKVGFVCLDRSSSEARRLLREAQRSDRPVRQLPSTKPSFVETLTVPSACEVY